MKSNSKIKPSPIEKQRDEYTFHLKPLRERWKLVNDDKVYKDGFAVGCVTGGILLAVFLLILKWIWG